MSLNINVVMIAGNLTRDPEVKFINDEKAVASFGMAINRKFKGSDGQMKEEVTLVDIEAWGRTAELVGQYLVKGRACYVEGRLRLDTWDDKKDGQKRWKLKVVADNVQFLGSKGAKADDDTAVLPPTAAVAVARERAQAGGGSSAPDEDPPFARSELEMLP